ALSFVAPLIALYLAAALLGERVAPRAIAASLLGLGGVVVLLLGGSAHAGAHPEAGWGTASILLSSVLYAWDLVLQRQQSLLARPVEVATFQTRLVAVVLASGASSLPQVTGT